MKRIAGLTWHGVDNFGSMLQAFALQYVITNGNQKHIYISYTKNATFKYYIYYYYRLIRSYLPWLHERKDLFSRFHRKYINCTFRLFTKKNISKVANTFDVYICGSDQIWAPNVLDSTFLLDFVSATKSKISYAASIGLNAIPLELVPVYKNSLKSFNAISVRERMGKKLLVENCKIDAEVVIDPTLLVDSNQWKKIEKKVPMKGEFVFCYFLSNKNDYLHNKEIKKIIANVPIVGVVSKENANSAIKNIYDQVGPAEFLWLIDHAKYVVTDSYHGAIFSILFKKKFILCKRFSENDPVCQNSRIEQLCDTLNLRKFYHHEYICVNDLEYYSTVESILKKERGKALSFLNKAIENNTGKIRGDKNDYSL